MTSDSRFYFVIRIAFSQEPSRVTSSHFRQIGFYGAVWVLAATALLSSARAQSPEAALPPAASGTVLGYVRDSAGRPLANASVFLQLARDTQATRTDSEGAYRFVALRAGAYTLRANMEGYGEANTSPVTLVQNETKHIDLSLAATNGSGAPATQKSQAPEFFDEPQFTVAGVTQATSSGGHGSDTVARTTEALAKATVSLGKERDTEPSVKPPGASESSLRDALERNPQDAALHHHLADVEEKLSHPLEAVREYQRAAELDPNEPDLFDWGTELLTHRALEPATEVLTKGNRLFPKSVRMLVALGVVWYARGSYDEATQYLGNAADLAPDDAAPYLFLGRMLSVETTLPPGALERLERFAQLQPNNALANYYFALSLTKQAALAADVDAERSRRVESHLEKAVHLDPKLGAAYLQLGTLYSQRADYSRAISAYQKAIEVGAENDETIEAAHYRLAQAYLRTGDKKKAQQELELHTQLMKQTKEQTIRERREIQEFVISLRKSGEDVRPSTVSPPQP
jgi:tetratricopeptide (TPR) repeat protein